MWPVLSFEQYIVYWNMIFDESKHTKTLCIQLNTYVLELITLRQLAVCVFALLTEMSVRFTVHIFRELM